MREMLLTCLFGFLIVILIGLFIDYLEKDASAGIPLGTNYRVKAIVTNAGVYQGSLAADTLISIMKNNGLTIQWYDFNDSTFKASAWTTMSVAMSEDTTNSDFNYYYYDWTVPASETAPDIYTFWVKCNGATKMYDASDLSMDRITFYFGQ